MERRDGGAGTSAGELLALIDRLEVLLEGSGLSEVELAVGETAIVLRKPDSLALDRAAVAALQSTLAGRELGPPATPEQPRDAEGDDAPDAAQASHAVLAPLTGIFYLSPSPEAAPYVREGGDVNVGQVIGLIEAMKLFNEIKSDVSGRVVRIAAETGTLVKARQPLIEVEPS